MGGKAIPKRKRPVRHPPRLMPLKIDVSPEQVAGLVLNVKPPEKWPYMQKDFD